jgi:diguanylate cyclase (GGDEF)-like protein
MAKPSYINKLLNRFAKERQITFIRLATAIAIIITMLSVSGIFIASKIVKEKSIRDLAKNDARQISLFIFESLYSGMVSGWTKNEISASIERLNRVEPDMKVSVFRGTPIIAEYGEMHGEKDMREKSHEIMDALKGKETLTKTHDFMTYYYPITAEQICLSCHKFMKVGDVAGVIVVSYPVRNLKISLNFLINTGLVFFTIFIVLSFAIFYSSIRTFILKPLLNLVNAIKDIIPQVNQNKNISVTSYIAEVFQLTTYFNKLLYTIYEYYKKLEELAIRDPLTKLYNRRKFEELLEYELYRSARYGHRFCLVTIDLDDFKQVNDTYGHPTGDIVLREIAALLNNSIRKSDIAARVGGDEFSIILSETDINGGLAVAEKLRQTVEKTPFSIMIGHIGAKASFGIAEYPANGEAVKILITASDVALYRAKRHGKNRVVAIDALGSDAREIKMEMIKSGEKLKIAIEENRVAPFFQPIIDTVTGELFGFNVMARIQEGDTFLLASQFISLAEELGYMDDIDSIIFNRGLESYASLKGKYHKQAVKLFFNISHKKLFSERFIDDILTAAIKYSAAPSNIVFQIAENDTLPQINNFISLAKELKKHGITFALKNFGSGFSSFMYLKYLDVAYVKIDGDYIRNLDSEARNRIFVSNMHQILSQLNIIDIAECVEDKESHDTLKEIGVKLGQGYYYGYPEASDASGSGMQTHIL